MSISGRSIPLWPGVTREELDVIRLQACAAASEAGPAPGVIVLNPHPLGSKHAVAWEVYFHEAQLAQQWAAEGFPTRSTAAATAV
jgi:hypothetical protein